MRGSILTSSGEPVQFGSIKLRKNCAIFSCLRLQRTSSIVKVRIKNPGKSWLTIHCLITVITNLVVVWLNVLSLWIVGMIGQWYHNHHCWRQSWNQWNVWENSEHNETEMLSIEEAWQQNLFLEHFLVKTTFLPVKHPFL